MKFDRPPIFTTSSGGVWGVDSLGRHWYVVHSKTLRAKRIGPVGGKRTNYFDAALAEADRRNQKEQA